MNRRKPLLALILGLPTTVGLALGFGRPALAQDSGQYRILHARYGTESRNVDVTQRLRELAGRDGMFQMGNDTFGIDPHPNQRKTLRIYARGRDGRTLTFEYPEDSWVDGSQFTGWSGGNWGQGGWNGGWGGGGGGADAGSYRILGAWYGTEQQHVEVTQRLRELARYDRTFRMGNDTFGIDPHPNRRKTLRIHARGRDGSRRTFEYAEGSLVDGSLFTGWSGGNWGQADSGGWGGSGGRPATPGQGRLLVVRATYGDGHRQGDVTRQLQGRVRGDRLEVRVGNDLAGFDPAPNARKTLQVTYTVGNGRQRYASAAEDDWLRLP